MNSDVVYIVHLRQPRRNDPSEKRSDPFWEFGSFGVTGCHSNNLMHKNNIKNLKKARFAFAQGGKLGFKLLFITPPLSLRQLDSILEANWYPMGMPFRYADAPLLIDNNEETDFPLLADSIVHINRSTPVAKFSSAFRSRATPISQEIAEELFTVYERNRRDQKNNIAKTYEEALPYSPPLVDSDRKKTYIGLLRLNGGKMRSSRRC